MKRFNCTLADKRGEFGECMEAHNTGRYVLFSDVEKLQRRMQEILDKSNSTGVAIERAISSGSVLADHPLKSRLDLLANHHKREQALADGMVAMADRCKLLTDLLREARNPLITAMEASSEDASAETCELLELIDSALAGPPQAQPDADWTEATTTPTEQDYRELHAQHDALQGKYKAAQNLVRDIVGFDRELEGDDGIGTMADRIDAILADQLPDPAVTVTETIRTAPERIWLQIGDQSHYHSEPFPSNSSEVSWCADSVMSCEVPYVRADLAGKLSDHHEQHPDDAAVDRFAVAMKTKLAAAREKGRGGWDNPATCSVEYLADLLVDHVGKGNAGTFEDVANFAMMLHQRGADPAVLASAATLTTCATCSGHGMIGGVTGQTPESMDFWEAGCPDCDGRGKVKVKTRTITEGQEFELSTVLQSIANGFSDDPAHDAAALLKRIAGEVPWTGNSFQIQPRQGGEQCDSASPSSSPA